MQQKTKALKLIKSSKFSAFTLIELLVVIAIVGILSGLIIMTTSNATNAANDAKRKANLDTIRKALLMYQTSNGGIYPIQTTICNIGDTGASGCTTNLNTALTAYFSVPPRDPNGSYYTYLTDTSGTYFATATVLSSGAAYSQSTHACGSTFLYGGKTYNTVQIGTQCWMKENLDVGTLTAGANTQGTSCTAIQKYCYSNTEANCTAEGGLYQWDQAMCGSLAPGAQGICPTGWHVPSDAEFKTLVEYLGTANCDLTGTNYGWACASAGLSLKEAGYVHWTNDSVPAHAGTNASGFTALGTGYRGTDGTFNSRSSSTFLWSSSPTLYRYLYYADSRVYRDPNSAAYGFSVRCLKN